MSKRLRNIWSNMKRRCHTVTNNRFSWYGAKGISVCDEWRHHFKPFHDWAMSHGYTDELTIDRIDNNGDYCPENCRWVTYQEQCNNTSRNVLVIFKGERKTLSEWSRVLGIQYGTLATRIRRGWSSERAFTTPVQTYKKG